MNAHIRRLRESIGCFPEARVLVIGDIILDHFLWGSATRISPEAPVPVVNVQKEEWLLGGSANVFRNIVSLGGRATLCGVIGADSMGEKVLELVRSLGGETRGLVSGSRPTTVKTRILAQGQQIVRVDREQTEIPSRKTLDRLRGYLEEQVSSCHAVMVSDYAKGMVNEELMAALHGLLQWARVRSGQAIPLIIDPKPVNFHHFTGATIITPNHHEALLMAGMRGDDERTLFAAARQIREDMGCEAVLVTRGEAGMALLQADDTTVTIPTMAKEVYDVTGAGDTVAATLSLGLACGCSMPEAAVLANHAAGIVVGKVGTASISAEELAKALEKSKSGLRKEKGVTPCGHAV